MAGSIVLDGSARGGWRAESTTLRVASIPARSLFHSPSSNQGRVSPSRPWAGAGRVTPAASTCRLSFRATNRPPVGLLRFDDRPTSDAAPIAQLPNPTSFGSNGRRRPRSTSDRPARRAALCSRPIAARKGTRRYYQDAAIRAVFEKFARGDQRALLTLATGAGKTFIAATVSAAPPLRRRWRAPRCSLRPRRVAHASDDRALQFFSSRRGRQGRPRPRRSNAAKNARSTSRPIRASASTD